jgi:hypothetical protein
MEDLATHRHDLNAIVMEASVGAAYQCNAARKVIGADTSIWSVIRSGVSYTE